MPLPEWFEQSTHRKPLALGVNHNAGVQDEPHVLVFPNVVDGFSMKFHAFSNVLFEVGVKRRQIAQTSFMGLRQFDAFAQLAPSGS
jgi:hypothetical protein